MAITRKGRVAGRESAHGNSKMASGASIFIAPVETMPTRVPERRHRPRIAAAWPLRVWRFQQPAIDAITVNVSSNGVHFVCGQPFSPGETIHLLLTIAGPAALQEGRPLILLCEAVVLRVEQQADASRHSVACRILNYSVERQPVCVSEAASR
jgi:hypothetical protein